jgi:hypothetical protein
LPQSHLQRQPTLPPGLTRDLATTISLPYLFPSSFIVFASRTLLSELSDRRFPVILSLVKSRW